MNTLFVRTKAFDLPFYPSYVKEWCILSQEIENSVSVNNLKQFSVLLNSRKTQLLQWTTAKLSNY